MKKEMEMQLAAVLSIFKQSCRQEYLGVFISELEDGNLDYPQTVFSLKKLVEFCNEMVGWEKEQKDLEQIIQNLEAENIEAERIIKAEAPINRLWVSFREWLYSELPYKDWLFPQYVEYDNWDNGTYYLNINFDSIFRLYLGIPYDDRYENRDHCRMQDIKLLIELLYREMIKVEARYDFTVQVNKMFFRFSLPYELKSGKLIKKGIKVSNRNLPIINFQMLESKIQWSEEKILGNEGLDKHTAINYITDALQYMFSLVNVLEKEELNKKSLKQRCALVVNCDENSKEYSVILKEVAEIQTIVNEYFDIRHNEYLSKISNSEREPLKDNIFIEYLYNRIYALLYLIKAKYLSYKAN